jgi:hypothetical protein
MTRLNKTGLLLVLLSLKDFPVPDSDGVFWVITNTLFMFVGIGMFLWQQEPRP